MTPLLAAALSGAVCGGAAGLVLDALRHRFLVGPPSSRWCRRCWCFAVVRMDGWDTCLRCGDARYAHIGETGIATVVNNYVPKRGGVKIVLLRGGRPETKP